MYKLMNEIIFSGTITLIALLSVGFLKWYEKKFDDLEAEHIIPESENITLPGDDKYRTQKLQHQGVDL